MNRTTAITERLVLYTVSNNDDKIRVDQQMDVVITECRGNDAENLSLSQLAQVAETDQLSYVGTNYDAESTTAGANTCKWVTDSRASLFSLAMSGFAKTRAQVFLVRINYVLRLILFLNSCRLIKKTKRVIFRTGN